MSWRPLSDLSSKRFGQRGLDTAIQAGLVCRIADQLHPEWYTATSFKNDTLHLLVKPEHLITVTLAQGEILGIVQKKCSEQSLAIPQSIRLTIDRK
jgi:hypothetical protein